MGIHARLVSGLLVASAILIAAGCGERTDNVQAAAPVTPPTDGDILAGLKATPLGWYTTSLPQLRKVLYDAEQRAASTCMAQKGMAYQPISYTPPAAQSALRSDIGVLTLAEAQAFGYHDPDGTTGALDDIQAPAGVPEEDFLAAYRGDGGAPAAVVDPRTGSTVAQAEPLGGCRLTAISQVYGSEAAYRRYVAFDLALQGAAMEVRDDVAADGGYQRVLGRWRACMKSRHRDVADPLAAASQAADVDQASASEKAAAVDDVMCKAAVQFLATVMTARAQAEKAVVDASPGFFRDAKELRAATLARVSALG